MLKRSELTGQQLARLEEMAAEIRTMNPRLSGFLILEKTESAVLIAKKAVDGGEVDLVAGSVVSTDTDEMSVLGARMAELLAFIFNDRCCEDLIKQAMTIKTQHEVGNGLPAAVRAIAQALGIPLESIEIIREDDDTPLNTTSERPDGPLH